MNAVLPQWTTLVRACGAAAALLCTALAASGCAATREGQSNLPYWAFTSDTYAPCRDYPRAHAREPVDRYLSRTAAADERRFSLRCMSAAVSASPPSGPLTARETLAYAYAWMRDNDEALQTMPIADILRATGLDRPSDDPRVIFAVASVAMSRGYPGCAVELAGEAYRRGLAEAMIRGSRWGSAAGMDASRRACTPELQSILTALSAKSAEQP